MDKYFSVESVSNNIVKLETPSGDFIELSLKELPQGIKEGDLLFKNKDVFEIDAEATKKRKKILLDKQNSLFSKRPPQ